ncbi:DnaJ-domain-containing protein [Punctularia strigosozonata HHB-11173 SS5]|uniref:DnaJ-domain-containing protein n=1 Tax=Punctularia strigosozonata (strain HHB-11173) TaxID=741275 RepID=UPI0004417A71|nr:DnaJ-domain-containing protein [Punctularia strigosozonata HHB-11173 SS5]EIN07258.1 DnaJ-domain-containing protein [Punctularia strigosozonata HHB-11173 SS5]
MVRGLARVSEAYTTLGLQDGANLEQVKSAYKQLALRTHPDKNVGNPDATEQFQRLSEAYNALVRHLDLSRRPDSYMPEYVPFPHGAGFAASFCDDFDGYEFDEDFYSDEYESEDADDEDFFMFLFEELMQGRASRFAHADFRRSRQEPETHEEFQARLRKTREEQAAAAKRRAQENEARKERERVEREQERKRAEERKKAKATKKKKDAAEVKKLNEASILAQRQHTQSIRSAIFAAARQGDAAKVKKGIWEDNVDASGGEVKPGCGAFVDHPPQDPRETLLHIAAQRGDLELVQWLDSHNAEVEERNSRGLSAFDVAMRSGNIMVMRYFLDNYDPADSDSQSLYAPAEGVSAIRLALESGNPDVIALALESKLSPQHQTRDAWSWAVSLEGKQSLLGSGSSNAEARYEQILDLLMSYCHFTPPLTPDSAAWGQSEQRTSPPPRPKHKQYASAKFHNNNQLLQLNLPSIPRQAVTPITMDGPAVEVSGVAAAEVGVEVEADSEANSKTVLPES